MQIKQLTTTSDDDNLTPAAITAATSVVFDNASLLSSVMAHELQHDGAVSTTSLTAHDKFVDADHEAALGVAITEGWQIHYSNDETHIYLTK